jgi:hypothetical protein
VSSRFPAQGVLGSQFSVLSETGNCYAARLLVEAISPFRMRPSSSAFLSKNSCFCGRKVAEVSCDQKLGFDFH